MVAGWCVASIVTALALGTWLRRRAEATDPEGALRPLDTGPLRLWLGEVPEVPETPEEMGRRGGWDGLVAGLPAPRRDVGRDRRAHHHRLTRRVRAQTSDADGAPHARAARATACSRATSAPRARIASSSLSGATSSS